MRCRSRRIVAAVGLVLLGASLLSGPGTGCVPFFGDSTLAAADFCFIFDCQNGLLGGTVDPCATTSSVGQGSQFVRPPFFADCPIGP